MRKLLGTLTILLFAVSGKCQPVPWVPLFQFNVFYYNTDMEIAPGGNTMINGPVQANANAYFDPQAPLLFESNVTASGGVYDNKSPLDPSSRTLVAPTFEIPPVTNIYPYRMFGDSAGTNGYGILTVPPPNQTPSVLGFFDVADMIVIVSNDNSVTVISGASVNNQRTVISSTQWSFFISTNGSFYDQRDSLTVNPVVLNISNLVIWSATNVVLRPVLSSQRGPGDADVQSIYVADLRSTSNISVTTNVTLTTNWFTNMTFPTYETYLPPVITNWIVTTNSTFPATGTYLGFIITNTVVETNTSPPSPGTYTGVVTTNTTRIANSTNLPAPGTYVGTVTTNKVGSHQTYTYNEITGYTYYIPTGYEYEKITGYIYDSIITNVSILTNSRIVSQPGIVLSNGAVLPPNGLSIATPDPAYITGNWNTMTSFRGSSDAGSSNVPYSVGSGIFADAITILSPAWNPSNSSFGINARIASSDTVVADFYTGNVPSNGTNYSGGLENLPRFLENWNGQAFTFNGSFACMFTSQIANAPWPGSGAVYNPPVRNWYFNTNANNPSRLPPMTPLLYPTITDTPAIQTSLGQNQSVILSWTSHPQTSYTVEYADSLQTTNWQPLTSFVASNSVASVSDTATNGQRFYRLQVSVP